jgi:hypothetical protein
MSIVLRMIDFLQKVFEPNEVIEGVPSGNEYTHFQAFQPESNIPLNESDYINEYRIPQSSIIKEV